jgi:hypothetical protein
MILATALEQSLRMSAATTASTGTLVLRFSVGILRAAVTPTPLRCCCALLVDRGKGERVDDETRRPIYSKRERSPRRTYRQTRLEAGGLGRDP